MADNKEITKVSLAMLEYYDTKIKAWHNEHSNSKRYVVFATRENFPTIGDSEVLYIDDDNKMYCWDASTSQYVLITAGGGDTNFSWGKF
ncbi:MAG: hypothetical protein K2N48_01675 [Muribaculaceae bacterium]|nr:hypothetical protein [Muribaculaceae bacterium]